MSRFLPFSVLNGGLAMHATPSLTREVLEAIPPGSGMHSSRGLLKILSPTQIASIAPVLSACTAMSMSSFGCVPCVTSAVPRSFKRDVVTLTHWNDWNRWNDLNSSCLERLNLELLNLTQAPPASLQPAVRPLARLASRRPRRGLSSIPFFVTLAPPGRLSLRRVKHRKRTAMSAAARRVL
jgi:hypothetical protein